MNRINPFLRFLVRYDGNILINIIIWIVSLIFTVLLNFSILLLCNQHTILKTIYAFVLAVIFMAIPILPASIRNLSKNINLFFARLCYFIMLVLFVSQGFAGSIIPFVWKSIIPHIIQWIAAGLIIYISSYDLRAGAKGAFSNDILIQKHISISTFYLVGTFQFICFNTAVDRFVVFNEFPPMIIYIGQLLYTFFAIHGMSNDEIDFSLRLERLFDCTEFRHISRKDISFMKEEILSEFGCTRIEELYTKYLCAIDSGKKHDIKHAKNELIDFERNIVQKMLHGESDININPYITMFMRHQL